MSFLITFVAMWALNYSINNLTLMALTLAIGFLVDDAIVFLENVVRRAEAGESIYRATLNSAGEISFTILSMTLSLAAVFIPLAFMPGLLGRIFREFAITIIVAIFASGLVSLTLTPLMCSRILAERGPGPSQDLDGANLQPLLQPDSFSSTVVRSTGFSITAGSRAPIVMACVVGVWFFFSHLPFTLLADRRQRGDSRFFHRPGRRLARSAAATPGQARSRFCRRIRRSINISPSPGAPDWARVSSPCSFLKDASQRADIETSRQSCAKRAAKFREFSRPSIRSRSCRSTSARPAVPSVVTPMS